MQMRCSWQTFIQLLPTNIRPTIDKLGADSLQELRLRMGAEPELIMQGNATLLDHTVTAEDISFVINAASRYSPWAASTIRRGYITAPGGHRVGLCGDAIIHNGEMSGIRNPYSVCIRVARDFPNIAAGAAATHDSILIIGKPGSGKTTLLRDLIRQRSNSGTASVGVVDERGEVFPVFEQSFCFPIGRRTDIITGCSKAHGIDLLLRTMGPGCIAVDEITAQEDCNALINAGWSGVSILATAHAGSVADLHSRPVYRPIVNSGLFQTVFIMQSDKSWRKERI